MEGVRLVARAWWPLMQLFLALTLLSTLMLYLGAEHTDRYFSWTVQPPMSAAFLGGGYAAGFLLVVLTARERVWANARVALLTVLVFVWLTAVATLLHLDRFHFEHPSRIAQFAAWLWITVYVVVPVWMAALTILQLRMPRADPPAARPLLAPLRSILTVQGVVLVGAGLPLMITPVWANAWWPWPVAPLAGRATGAWLIALGFAALLAALAERDLTRLRAASWTYTAFAALQAAALVRFAPDVRWHLPATWAWIALLLSIAAIGLYGVGATCSSRPRDRQWTLPQSNP